MEPNIKKIWGIAKSPELKLTDEELHLVVQAHTGKDSIKALNKRELQTVIRVLGSMKDSAKKSERGRSRFSGKSHILLTCLTHTNGLYKIPAFKELNLLFEYTCPCLYVLLPSTFNYASGRLKKLHYFLLKFCGVTSILPVEVLAKCRP